MLRRYTEQAQKAIVMAESIAFNLGHQNVGSEHLLLALLKMPEIPLSMELNHWGMTFSKVEADLERMFDKNEEELFYLEYSHVFNQILETAYTLSSKQDCEITIDILSQALLMQKESVAYELLVAYQVDVTLLLEHLSHQQTRNFELDKMSDLVLLNEKVKKEDPIFVGRKEELTLLLEILCRKEKNNVILVGDAGVGKTALVEKLAMVLNELEQGHPLCGKRIYELDLAGVVAGTKYRGEFEEKFKKIISQVKKDRDAIIFIDEIHNLVGAGGAEGAIDASNILKPYLARKELTCIGATTFEEYRRYFEKDHALNRRFGRIDLKEQSPSEIVQILKALKPRFEAYHQVTIQDDLLQTIVTLSSRYIKERHQPDLAIDVLDLACVRTKMNAKTQVDVAIIKQVIEKISGKKFSLASPLATLEKQLTAHVFGQENVMEHLINQLSMIEQGIHQDGQPQGVFLFAGPTGVGKTECAKLIAEYYYSHLIRLDMALFKESHSVAKIVGSPPGYVGFEEVPYFLDEVRRHPHSVILLDEIDKAHQDVLQLFLQIFDEGYLVDQQKNIIDFSNALMIMTTNMGYQFSLGTSLGFQKQSENLKAKEMIEKHFFPEFLNRIDEIFYFQPLDKQACKKIAQNYLKALSIRQPSLDLASIINNCEIEKYGARALQRDLRKAVFKQMTATR